MVVGMGGAELPIEVEMGRAGEPIDVVFMQAVETSVTMGGFVLEIALAIMSVAVGLIVALAGSWMAVCFTGLVVMSVTVAASKA
jgi:uncharacterized membrane protein